MSTSEQIQAFVIFFGPSCLGLLVSVLTGICARKLRWLFVGYILSVLLHLVTVTFVAVFVGIGEAWSGTGEAHDYPAQLFMIGLVVLAVPMVARLIREGMRSPDKESQGSTESHPATS